MKTTSDLFDLIKSLTKSEKRHFTIFASKHVIGEKNNYLRLFKAIDAQQKYDEAAIREQFKGEVFLKQLPVTKNYLYGLILKSMRIYRSGITVEVRLQEMLQDIEFLYDKGMLPQCRKIIVKAKELGYQYQKFRMLLLILEWQRKALTEQSTDDDEINSLHEEEAALLLKVQNTHEYNILSSAIFSAHRRKGRPRTSEEFRRLEEIAAHPLLQEESTALSEEARIRFYNIRAAVAQGRSDAEGYYVNCKNLIGILEANPACKTEGLNKYINMLHNFVDACACFGKYAELYETLDKLRALPAECPNLKARIFSTVAAMEASMIQRTGQTHGAEELLARIQSEFKEHKDKITQGEALILKFNLALSYFILGKYREALYWANGVINSEVLPVREDMYCMCRLFCLIIHYELGNLDFLEYSVKSTYRYLSQRNKIFDFEKATLDFIRRLPRVTNKHALIEDFKELRTQLLRINEENSQESAPLNTFEILSWLDSKIEGVPLITIIQRRAAIMIQNAAA